MKPSQNQIAEMLFHTVALEATGIGSSRQRARRRRAADRAVGRGPDRKPSFATAAGSSRYDYISPRTVVRILDAMRRSPNFKVYYDALPIGGVDGTIRNRMKGTPAENNVHAKTGSVALARSLSGYVTTAERTDADLQLPLPTTGRCPFAPSSACRTRSPRDSRRMQLR